MPPSRWQHTRRGLAHRESMAPDGVPGFLSLLRSKAPGGLVWLDRAQYIDNDAALWYTQTPFTFALGARTPASCGRRVAWCGVRFLSVVLEAARLWEER